MVEVGGTQVEKDGHEGHPEDGDDPPGRAREELDEVRVEEANVAVDGRVHPVVVVLAEPAHLPEDGLGPVDDLVLVGVER